MPALLDHLDLEPELLEALGEADAVKAPAAFW